MEIIPLMADILIYLIGFLVFIVILTYILKMFKKKDDEVEEKTNADTTEPKLPVKEPESIISQKKDNKNNKVELKSKEDIAKLDKDDSAVKKDLFKTPPKREKKEEPKEKKKNLFEPVASLTGEKKPRKSPHKSTDSSSPRFQVLNNNFNNGDDKEKD